MKRQHISGSQQTSQRLPLVYIAWDLQNVKCRQNKLLDLTNYLLTFARQQGKLNGSKVYCNSEYKDQATAKKLLETTAFQCVDVLCKSKNSADNQIMVDCIRQVALKPSPDIIILVLADWDYAGLICVLRQLGKKVIIFAQRGNESQRLINLVDEFYFIDQLPQLIGSKAA
ncbi:MAG: NYN domain-containing protein [Crinalium sp.]